MRPSGLPGPVVPGLAANASLDGSGEAPAARGGRQIAAAPIPASNRRRSSRRFRSAMVRCGSFSAYDVQSAAIGAGGWRHFFAANRRAHVISPPPAASRPDNDAIAGVAELVDALDLGSSDESCGGSSPSARTKRFQRLQEVCSRACFRRVRRTTGAGF
jgi:hypothetical protein